MACSKTRIHVWADSTWCLDEDIEEYTWMSDDYMTIEVPDSVEDIDAWVAETRPQG